MWLPSFLLGAVAFTTTVSVSPRAQHDQPKYSIQMATSIMSRRQGILLSTSDRSNLLQAGFTQKTFRKLVDQYPKHPSTRQISSYMSSSVASVIPTVYNATLDTTFPLDRLSSGNGLLYASQSKENQTYRMAYDALLESVDLQPRNTEGSLWYYVYPNYTYLDGMYSLAPFLTLYASLNTTSLSPSKSAAMVDDVIKQLDLAWNHTYQASSGLLVHGYDASKRAPWADPMTGASHIVWGRSLGWYCMALLDTLDLVSSFASAESARDWLLGHFQTLMEHVVATVDGKAGAWWQVMDQPGREGNYIESSASAMFVYALLRGKRLGYLEIGSVDVATRAYEYLVDNFVVQNGNGTLGWNGTVSVCSLNSTATYEYYIGQPILYDSVLGSAAFVLASLEYERLDMTVG
ncbi:Six-hairpin glycosidase-like protein [Phaeosphaeria sp. MPI-PUGE-AT-0046c]|nr:Six-hairpin glycosidase-like protein [Phaeosphaeria sp. MPI-PUGE-AT-0046c]